MSEYLFKATIDFGYLYKGDKSPVYVVASSRKAAREYVGSHLRNNNKVKNITLIGERLGMNMYHGKPKKGTTEYNTAYVDIENVT